MRNLPTSAWSENKKRLQIGLGMKQIETETSPLTLFMQKSWRSASHREALSMTPLQRAAANSESFKPKGLLPWGRGGFCQGMSVDERRPRGATNERPLSPHQPSKSKQEMSWRGYQLSRSLCLRPLS